MRITLFALSFLFCSLAKAQQQFQLPVAADEYYQNNSIPNPSTLIPVKKGDQLVITPKVEKAKHKHYFLNGLLKSIGTGLLTYKTTKTVTGNDKQLATVAHQGIGLTLATSIAAGTPDYLRAFKHRRYPEAIYSFYNKNKELVSNHIIKLKGKNKKPVNVTAAQDGYISVRLLNKDKVLPNGYFDVKVTSPNIKSKSTNGPVANSFGNEDPIDPDLGEDADMVLDMGGVVYSFYDEDGDGYMDKVAWDNSAGGVSILSLSTPYINQSNYETVMSGYNPYSWNNNIDDYLTWYQQEYSNPPTSATATSDSLVNPCLESAKTNLLKSGVSSSLLTGYNANFGGSNPPLKMNYVEDSTVSYNGVSQIAQSFPGADGISWTIKLNPSFGHAASQQMIAAEIAHEIGHFFLASYRTSIQYSDPTEFNRLGTAVGQHEWMIVNMTTDIADLLQKQFGLSYIDAMALALSGYDDVFNNTDTTLANTYKNYIASNFNINFSQVYSIANDYMNGIKGNVCP